MVAVHGPVLALGPAGWVFVRGVVWPLWRRLGPVQVARYIESSLPAMHNRLVSCVDLAATGGPQQQSRALYRLLVQETLERIRGFQPQSLIDLRMCKCLRLFCAGSVVSLVLAALLFGSRLPVAMVACCCPLPTLHPPPTCCIASSRGRPRRWRGENITFTALIDTRRSRRAGSGTARRCHFENLIPWSSKMKGHGRSLSTLQASALGSSISSPTASAAAAPGANSTAWAYSSAHGGKPLRPTPLPRLPGRQPAA